MAFAVIKDIAVDFGDSTFIEPYLKRELGVTDDDPPLSAKGAVRIVTDESEAAASAEFDAYCAEHQLPVAVLRCPYIVGTGMAGLVMRIAAGIYGGKYVHIQGNEARISVVHAVDVARAIALAVGTQGAYTLTDSTDPSIHALAEALAYRIDDKRIVTIKPRWARLWYGGSYYRTLTTSHTAEQTFTDAFPEFRPVEVVEYLRTHVYDDSSL